MFKLFKKETIKMKLKNMILLKIKNYFALALAKIWQQSSVLSDFFSIKYTKVDQSYCCVSFEYDKPNLY